MLSYLKGNLQAFSIFFLYKYTHINSSSDAYTHFIDLQDLLYIFFEGLAKYIQNKDDITGSH